MNISTRSELEKKESFLELLYNETDSPITILDIGCYDGKDTFDFIAFGDFNIHCFEADPRSIELFKKERERMFYKNRDQKTIDHFNSLIHLHEKAIGNTNGTVTLHQSDSTTRRHYEDQKSWSASSSLSKPKTHLQLFPDVQFDNTIEVECIKLDTWYDTMFEDTIIDLIWCDVNGAEEGVILGGLETLNNCVRYFYCEFSDKELYEGQITKEKLLSLLPNFEEIGIYNYEQGNFGNILLKNKNL